MLAILSRCCCYNVGVVLHVYPVLDCHGVVACLVVAILLGCYCMFRCCYVAEAVLHV